MQLSASSMRLSAAIPAGFALLILLSACWPSSQVVPSVSSAEIAGQIGEPSAPILLDVRSPEEFREGRIPGAINIPYDTLEARLAELPAGKDDQIVVYCRSGRRAVIAEQILLAAGYRNVRDLDGHMLGWNEAGLITEP